MANPSLSYRGTNYLNHRNVTNQYLVKEILEATPQKLLLRVYDFAIVHCQKRDLAKTNKALQVLISALRYDTEEVKNISIGLFRLYQYCQDKTREGNFDEAYKILVELRKSWSEIF
ncbi:MAG TPA: flagellar protein FliS [Ignavibacteriaceae bacterium]|nr:flagellar protein FliS [Ignavibacteriaceae bacterium]